MRPISRLSILFIATAGCNHAANPNTPFVCSSALSFVVVAPAPVVGAQPAALATGDVNGDGNLDIVVTAPSENEVDVFLGNGKGAFQVAQPYPSGSGPTAVAVGDINNNGKIDVVTTSPTTSTVSVLWNGSGGFPSGPSVPSYATGSGPLGLVLGDFNSAGGANLAIVTANNSGSLSLLQDSGNNLLDPNNNPIIGEPVAVAAIDMNGDGYLDLVSANQNPASISVLLGGGDGTFPLNVTMAIGGSGPVGVAVGDFDGDGNPDVVTANGQNNSISVLFGNGDGTCSNESNYPVGHHPTAVVVGDFDGDGNLDIATANGGGNTVSVLLGNGDGTFASPENYPTGSNPTALVTADFNGDEKLDLATANSASANLTVLLNTCH